MAAARPGLGWCCDELCPRAAVPLRPNGVPLRPNGVLLPLQQLVVEKKEETNMACGRTRKARESGRKSGGSLGNKWRKEKGALGKAAL